ncbi:toxin [Bacillus phage vB_BanS-Tsamsa]|uniref:Uncharacterized protein n=1 Tax=Bacillus phage vB_BanS-Tsamsa TaxID=1308863 RepID=U5J9I6_9CAUD|nr:toxin [Bacillus phage vB_BanS-Tsamsa]AGI11942.1 hypothetical protein [Bacillus phage vB_BanS-Tsamsa]
MPIHIIKELERIIIEDNLDGTQTTRLPNNAEMMEKINEIVKQVNFLTRTKPLPPIKPVSSSPRRSY